ncbi:MAG: VWA domain-containing protein, partial [Cellvibrionaceae bacterium]|nr:VWA domain-containing protein [Cellvibrionaceae bacterium]
MFEFAWLWAFALLPLPWLVRRFAPAAKVEQQAGLQVPFIDNLAAVAAQSASSGTLSERGPLLLGVLVWACLVTAVAKPQWLGEPIPQPLSGRDIMLAVDLSESMLESDFVIDRQRVDRLTATKVVAGDFIERREGDRVGLLLFADQAYLQAPLTRDRATVRQLLDEAQVGLAGRATAIGDVIGLAVKRFKTLQSSQRILVLMTDGENTAGALA